MEYVKDLSQNLKLSDVGGKAHNLSLMLRADFPVQKGVVLTAPGLARHYYDANIHPKLLRRSIQENPLPRDISAELRRKLRPEKTDRFAVRSSALSEDGDSFSCAGQYLTLLNVTPENMDRSVRACLASLWAPSAVAYREKTGIEETSMGVVIQRMVPADAAGVAFSVDPIGGRLDRVLVEAAPGLGEAVVSGENLTQTWLLDAESGNIVEENLGDEMPACLRDGTLKNLSRLTKKVEAFYGAPQDIEWALHGVKLVLLQSRPINSIAPRFTRDESAERFPDALTPLTWSYVEEAFNDSLEYSLKLLDIKLPTRPWFAKKAGFIYGNQNAVQLLGGLTRPTYNSANELRYNKLDILKKHKWIDSFLKDWHLGLDTFLEKSANLPLKDDMSMPEFQAYLKEAFGYGRDYFRPNIAISLLQASLTRNLRHMLSLFLPDPKLADGALVAILSGTQTMTGRINQELSDLSAMVADNSSLKALLNSGGSRAFTGLAHFPEFSKKLARFLEEYGHRETTFDYYHPTWAEAPWVLLDLIRCNSTRPAAEAKDSPAHTDASPHKSGNSIAQKPEAFLSFIPEDLQNLFLSTCRLTLELTALDDLEHFHTTRLNLLARKALAYPGYRLFRKDQIEDPYDLFFLKKSELESLEDFDLSQELQHKIKYRKAEYKDACNTDPAWDLNKAKSVPRGDLKGVPGSPGEAEGEIYLVRGPADFAAMPENCIMVARTTNPAWTPLFFRAAGIITESGGPLSHGAVTARELGKPAVMSIRGVLSLFKNGDRVRIDGASGTIMKVLETVRGT